MYKSLQLKILFIFGLLVFASCAPAVPKASTPVSEEELNAAIKEAQGSMDTLLQAMIAPKPSYDFLGIKVRFTNRDGEPDDNWVEPVEYADGRFVVQMMDSLTYDTNLHADHTLDVPAKKVVDWMIVEKDGTLLGGYTIRLAYQHMSQDEKKEFLRITKYKLK
ncbi:MAG: DUF2314 domain-containing protein [Bacteroidota bacterium]